MCSIKAWNSLDAETAKALARNKQRLHNNGR